MNFRLTDPDAIDLAKIMALALNVSFEQLEQQIGQQQQKRIDAAARKNASFDTAERRATEAQNLRRYERERNGYRLIRIWTNRASGRVALMMQKDEVWNAAKSRMGRKLVAIYPDGTQSETFEKSISVRSSF